ncbi:DNA (Cytosine-5-)-methyltransferase [Fusarium proliferatum]|nr:DNA (Cytosine-5-)-methyltransferase [Fusarium proliferatum]
MKITPAGLADIALMAQETTSVSSSDWRISISTSSDHEVLGPAGENAFPICLRREVMLPLNSYYLAGCGGNDEEPLPVDEVISNSGILEGVLDGGLVDILHCSPPCQPFSPAHTRASERDQDNIDALFACCELVKRLRPRIVTVEQTFGLARPGHTHVLQTFLSDFTQHGYSIRYRVARLWGLGIPQKRHMQHADAVVVGLVGLDGVAVSVDGMQDSEACQLCATGDTSSPREAVEDCVWALTCRTSSLTSPRSSDLIVRYPSQAGLSHLAAGQIPGIASIRGDTIGLAGAGMYGIGEGESVRSHECRPVEGDASLQPTVGVLVDQHADVAWRHGDHVEADVRAEKGCAAYADVVRGLAPEQRPDEDELGDTVGHKECAGAEERACLDQLAAQVCRRDATLTDARTWCSVGAGYGCETDEILHDAASWQMWLATHTEHILSPNTQLQHQASTTLQTTATKIATASLARNTHLQSLHPIKSVGKIASKHPPHLGDVDTMMPSENAAPPEQSSATGPQIVMAIYSDAGQL